MTLALAYEKGRDMGKRNWLLIACCLVAAFVGGAVSNWALSPQLATAAEKKGVEVAPVQQEVRARSFVLVDDNGKDRAALAMTEDGPRLFLSDENGEPRVTLSVQKDGARLSLWDENGKNRVGLSVLKNGPGVSVTKDMPNLTLMDGKGKVVWKAP